MKKIICLLVLVMLVSGCATMYTTRVNQLKSIYLGVTSGQVRKELGKSIKSEYFNDGIYRLTYKSFHWGDMANRYFWLYFRDNELVRISECGMIKAFTELDDLYALGIISREDYQSRHQQLVQKGMMIMQFMQAMPSASSYDQPVTKQSPRQHQDCTTTCTPIFINAGMTGGSNCHTQCH